MYFYVCLNYSILPHTYSEMQSENYQMLPTIIILSLTYDEISHQCLGLAYDLSA
jgi:hypothetical protein